MVVGMIACTEKNTPSSPTDSGSTGTETGTGTDTTGTDTTGTDTTAIKDTAEVEISSDSTNIVKIVYNGSDATITVPSHLTQYVTAEQNGAHVTIVQSNTSAVNGDEITYQLSGSSSNGSLTLGGSYKCTLALSGVTLTNPSGAAINITNSKRIELSAKQGTVNTLTDGASGEQKACLYSKGQLQLKGNGTLNVVGKTKHAIKSASYIAVKNLNLNITSAVSDGINCEEYILIESGTIHISGVGDDGIQCDLGGTTSTGVTTDHEDEDTGNIYISGGTIIVNCAYKGIKCEGDLTISDGDIRVTSTASASSNGNHGWSGDSSSTSSPEAIEAKGTMTISGGHVYAYSADDALNAGSHLTISGGLVYAHSTSNDGIDSNGNCYIKGGVVYAISATSPEVGIDANTEGGYKLYVSGGTIFVVGGLESGASLTQTCYSASSWSRSTWYGMTVGNETYAFKTPSSGGTTLVVSGASQPTLKSGVTPSGTEIFNGEGFYPATLSGGSSVSLSTYTGGNGGPGGGGPGGGGRWW